MDFSSCFPLNETLFVGSGKQPGTEWLRNLVEVPRYQVGGTGVQVERGRGTRGRETEQPGRERGQRTRQREAREPGGERLGNQVERG